MWRSLTEGERGTLVIGFEFGVRHAAYATTFFWEKLGYIAKQVPQPLVDQLLRDVGPDAGLRPVVEGMTKLYEDPANTYVSWTDAILITWDRLRGLDVENKIREARQQGLRRREKARN